MSDRPEAQSDPAAPTRRTVLRAAGLVALTGRGAGRPGRLCRRRRDRRPAHVGGPPPHPHPPRPRRPRLRPLRPRRRRRSRRRRRPPRPPKGPSVAAAKVPVGGGVIRADADYVVTQPQEGTYKAFAKTCTHEAVQGQVSQRRHHQLQVPRQQVLHRRRVSGPPARQLPARGVQDHRLRRRGVRRRLGRPDPAGTCAPALPAVG